MRIFLFVCNVDVCGVELHFLYRFSANSFFFLFSSTFPSNINIHMYVGVCKLVFTCKSIDDYFRLHGVITFAFFFSSVFRWKIKFIFYFFLSVAYSVATFSSCVVVVFHNLVWVFKQLFIALLIRIFLCLYFM